MGDKLISTTNNRGVTPYTFSGGTGGMGCHSLAESGTSQVTNLIRTRMHYTALHAEHCALQHRAVEKRESRV